MFTRKRLYILHEAMNVHFAIIRCYQVFEFISETALDISALLLPTTILEIDQMWIYLSVRPKDVTDARHDIFQLIGFMFL